MIGEIWIECNSSSHADHSSQTTARFRRLLFCMFCIDWRLSETACQRQLTTVPDHYRSYWNKASLRVTLLWTEINRFHEKCSCFEWRSFKSLSCSGLLRDNRSWEGLGTRVNATPYWATLNPIRSTRVRQTFPGHSLHSVIQSHTTFSPIRSTRVRQTFPGHSLHSAPHYSQPNKINQSRTNIPRSFPTFSPTLLSAQ